MDYIAHFEQNTTIILLAAGESRRFCYNNFPKKQWLRVGEIPLWQIVVQKFYSFGFKNIILTVSKNEAVYIRNTFLDCFIVEGGDTRTQSILQALKTIKTPLVLISDIARWNVQRSIIEELFRVYASHQDTVCIAPALRVSDTIVLQESLNKIVLPREQCLAVQTPQLSQTAALKEALKKGEFSDESTAILALGRDVKYIQGSPLLHKITSQDDLYTLCDLKKPSQQVLIGNGLDIHAFEEGKVMRLCGVDISSPVGFKAHSDGDVGLHAIIDAILGAIGAGDIGEWFPDTDEQYQNIDSVLLLKDVLEFVRNIGFVIRNIDLTIIAQTPKIGPYKQQIRERLAELFNLALSCINIKATTGEGVGFIGRQEGVCVMSSVGVCFFDWSEYLKRKGNI